MKERNSDVGKKETMAHVEEEVMFEENQRCNTQWYLHDKS